MKLLAFLLLVLLPLPARAAAHIVDPWPDAEQAAPQTEVQDIDSVQQRPLYPRRHLASPPAHRVGEDCSCRAGQNPTTARRRWCCCTARPG